MSSDTESRVEQTLAERLDVAYYTEDGSVSADMTVAALDWLATQFADPAAVEVVADFLTTPSPQVRTSVAKAVLAELGAMLNKRAGLS